MTTSIKDIADFVRIINEQPEWGDTVRGILLGQEVLDLPRLLAEFISATNERLTRLETLVAEFVQSTNERLARLETDVAELKDGQARLKTDVAELKDGQARLEWRFVRLEGRVGRLEGAELERAVHANIVNIASRGLGLNRTRVLQSSIIPRGPELQDAIDDAEEQGIITAEQGSHLEQTDVIIAARRKSDRLQCYAAVEISAGIRDRDITRARDRAQTLSTIMATPVIPVTVGASIATQQRELAQREGVSVIITPRLAPRTDENTDNETD